MIVRSQIVAATVSEYTICDLRSVEEIQGVEQLQKDVWGFSDREIIPMQQLIPATELGGILIGGFHQGTLAGFVYGFLGREHGRLVLHSQMLAVDRAHRNAGLGRALKLAQREQALAAGIDRITWTFDPLQCPNAHFNFARLGALCDTYRVNFYGECTSSFLHQTGTDRLWMTWPITSPRVAHRLRDGLDQEELLWKLNEASVVLAPIGGNGPGPRPEGFGAPWLRIELPDAAVRDSSLAREWRAATRAAFRRAVDEGYVVTEYCRLPGGGYLLEKGAREELA